MSKLSERCEKRKAEAEALAEKYNAGLAELEKMKNANAELLEQFKAAKYKYDELAELVKEEEGIGQTTAKVVE
tara:strand:- start:31 stop:249 length:219 start_codon:yes stop_codon:yes gene_type:complete